MGAPVFNIINLNKMLGAALSLNKKLMCDVLILYTDSSLNLGSSDGIDALLSINLSP